MRAIVRKVVPERGFGFAILSESADDVFIHAKDYTGGPFAELTGGRRSRSRRSPRRRRGFKRAGSGSLDESRGKDPRAPARCRARMLRPFLRREDPRDHGRPSASSSRACSTRDDASGSAAAYRDYYRKNRDRALARAKRQHEANREARLIYLRAWHKQNPKTRRSELSPEERAEARARDKMYRERRKVERVLNGPSQALQTAATELGSS